MNEKHIQQVLEIEKQAQEIQEAAVREAQQLPILAEQEAQALVEKAKAMPRRKPARWYPMYRQMRKAPVFCPRLRKKSSI